VPRIEGLLTGRQLLALQGGASVLEAARFMAEQRIGAVLITDRESRIQGIFTERDLMTRVVVPERDPKRVRLEEVMTREVFSTSLGAQAADVRRELQRRHIRHVPVVDGGRAVAMLSLRDLLAADLREAALEKNALSEYIQGSPDTSA
jgi:signal-transduction protein with cAMP-binding, CBS, and nucleotidyltransferase domain